VAELVEREVPAVAPLSIRGRTLHQHEDLRFAVYPRRGGRAPELDRPEVLQWIGRFLGRIHAVGASGRFSARPRIDIASHGDGPRQWLLESGVIPEGLRSAWSSTVDMAIEGVRRCYARLGDHRTLRLHGDCHGGNVLWTDDGPHFVDFDDACTGPAVQDLWMLLSGDREAMEDQLGQVLSGYEQFREFDRSELVLVEALRTLRLIHHSAWLARRWDDPAFPAAFTWFGTERYWQDQVLALREQIALMDEHPLIPA
jgi:Ser/Thr protein kinase RdoA (MazF antagonist)